MRDRELYAKILGIFAPWHVTDVVLDVSAGTVDVFVEHRGQASWPKCGKPCAGYDARRRRWRHLDTCQFQTYLTADVPRVECAEHGDSQAATPWAEPGSRFTALLEAVVIDWLKEAASRLWDYASIGWARKAWLTWAALASRSRLEPMVRAARMVRTHLEGILNAVVLRATIAAAESMNARIQRIKQMACGYRNRERFRNAILFQLGGLDLYPRAASAHTKA